MALRSSKWSQRLSLLLEVGTTGSRQKRIVWVRRFRYKYSEGNECGHSEIPFLDL